MTASTRATPAARAADHLLATHHPAATLPIPVEAIAHALGYRVLRNHHDGPQISFYLQDANARPHLGLNTAMSPGRQRFAAAHALGHGLLHPRDLIICSWLRLHDTPENQRPTEATAAEETAATRFATELLMPRQVFIEHVGRLLAELPPGFLGTAQRDDMVQELARAFGVSWEAVRFRLMDLALIGN